MKKIDGKIKSIFEQSNQSDWEIVRFGDVVNEVKETSSDPISEGIKHVVGLEHITPLDVHVRHWDDLDKGTTFTRKFKQGQVLFGRRRAYQRKAALAEFDGICSSDIIVLEANEKKLDPSLLPFLVLSDRFYKWAVSTSAGSLSPRTKFKYLAEFEFRLPPRSLQEKISRLLWAADRLKEKHAALLKSHEDLLSSWFSEGLSKISKGEKQSLGSMLLESPKYGASISAVPYQDDMPRYVRITDIGVNGKLKDDDIVTIGTKFYEKYLLSNNDILIARTADPGKCFLYVEAYGPCVYAGYLIKFKLDESKILPKFFYLYSKSAEYKSYINSTRRTGTISNINSKEFQAMPVPIIDISGQRSLIEKSLIFEEALLAQERSVDATSRLISSVINTVLS